MKDSTITHMQFTFKVIQIVLSVLLLGLILVQNKGIGLSNTFGGGEVYFTRRGAEKIIFIVTILIALFFIATSFINVLLN